jgi:hypothetical protein
MRPNTWYRLLAVLLAFALVAAACGGDDDDPIADAPAADDGGEPEEASDDGSTVAPAGLADVCPNPFIIQSDWFPESEHGAIYELIGDGYSVNADQKSVRGPMVLGGQDLGIEVEVRAGGPALGGQSVSVIMATDDDITLGYGSTDQLVLRYETAPLKSVLAPLENNPQIVMWDPESLPGVETIADLGELGTTIQVFSAGTWQLVLAGLGVIDIDQVDPSYDGSPARFIAEGNIAQQGFASAEPYEYENNIEEYGRKVGFQLLSDAGFEIYSQTLAIRPDRQEELDACLQQVVPIIQQAAVNFYASPDRTNATIIDAVEQYDTFWSYEPGLAAYSVQAQLDLGLAGNGPDSTIGNMDLDRIQGVMDAIRLAGLEFPEDLTPEDITTNEYIDNSIGLPPNTGGGSDTDEDAAPAALADVCPNPFIIQSDWFPESEHGAIYELIGDGYSVNADQKSVRGPMVLGGQDLGIEVEVRAGGPALGGQSVSVIMATDDDITLGYGSTDQLVLRYETAPLKSVLAPLENNPQIVMWDPESLPGVETIADLGELGTTIQVFSAGTWQLVLAGLGVIDIDQVDPSYDGSPARFIAEGNIAQQGFASAEPYEYENNIEEYGRKVGFQLLSDAGFEIYSQTLAIRPDRQEELDACLQQVVPIIQQAAVNFYASPDRTNATIIDAVEQYDTFWSYEPGLAAYSVQAQLDLGLAGNGPDSTIGNMDLDRIQGVMDAIRLAGLEFPEDLTPEDITTNEYIDESIGFS